LYLWLPLEPFHVKGSGQGERTAKACKTIKKGEPKRQETFSVLTCKREKNIDAFHESPKREKNGPQHVREGKGGVGGIETPRGKKREKKQGSRLVGGPEIGKRGPREHTGGGCLWVQVGFGKTFLKELTLAWEKKR